MKQVFHFLEALKQNNNRPWFQENKESYEICLAEVISLADKLLTEMLKHDQIETPTGKKSIKRIYRDVRFSKDKSPYKTHWGGRFTRATKEKRGSYYFHLEPGNSFLVGGFWSPNKEDMKIIRNHLQRDSIEYRTIINSRTFKKTFGEVQGQQLKKSPKGYEIDDPNIEFLKYKQFLLIHKLADKDVLSTKFPQKASMIFSKMRPYFDLMSSFLTTDLNGEQL